MTYLVDPAQLLRRHLADDNNEKCIYTTPWQGSLVIRLMKSSVYWALARRTLVKDTFPLSLNRCGQQHSKMLGRETERCELQGAEES